MKIKKDMTFAAVTGLNVRKEQGVNRFDEQRLIRNFINAAGLDSSAGILDVGCGFGQKMEWLAEDGFTPHGVDINPESLEKVRNKGFRGMTPDEFFKIDYVYNLMLMSHVVEHFHPADLLHFMDSYLDKLKSGGFLIIASPLEWENFYDDFDHIKIYHPQTFIMVSDPEFQQQYHLRNRLKMVCLGLRRQSWKIPEYEEYFYRFKDADFLWRLIRSLRRRMSKFIFNSTGGSLGGITTGWVGMYQKVTQ